MRTAILNLVLEAAIFNCENYGIKRRKIYIRLVKDNPAGYTGGVSKG
jgi:hypothetical protein